MKVSDILHKATFPKELHTLRKLVATKSTELITFFKVLRQAASGQLRMRGLTAKGAHVKRSTKPRTRLVAATAIGIAIALSVDFMVISMGANEHGTISKSSSRSSANSHTLTNPRDRGNSTQANYPISSRNSRHAGHLDASPSPQSELLELANFPKGWSSSPYTGAPGGGGTGLEGPSGASCLGVSTTTLDVTPPSANSAYFGQASSGVQVQETVEVFASTTAAHTDFLTFDSPKAPSCMATILGANFQQEIKAVLVSGTSVGAIKAAIVPIGRFATRVRNVSSHDIQITFPLMLNTKSSAMYLDIVMIQSGRSEATVDITDLNTAPSQSLLRFIATKAANRL